MADLHRVARLLVWFAFGFALVFRGGVALAEGTVPSIPSPAGFVAPTSPGAWHEYGVTGPDYQSGGSGASACAAAAAYHGQSVVAGGNGVYFEAFYGRYFYDCRVTSGQKLLSVRNVTCPSGSAFLTDGTSSVADFGGGNYCYSAGGAEVCPANSTGPVASVCTCSSGFDPAGAACAARSCPTGTGSWTGQYFGGAGRNPSSACLAGCGFSLTSVVSGRARVTGLWQWEGRLGAGTGEQCTGSGGGSAVPNVIEERPVTSEGSCLQKGLGFATVNGVTVCTEPSPENPVERTGTSTTTGPTGGTTETTTTETNGGTVKTTTTTTPEGGSPVTTTEEKPKEEYCEQHPQSKICLESAVSGGALCTSPPSCDGDAATCAIVSQAYKTRCEVEKLNEEGEMSALGDQVIAGNDPLKSSFPSALTAPTTALPAISQSSFLGGGDLADEVFVVMGNEVTLPWSQLNSVLSLMGSAMVALAMLAASRIVGVM